MEHLPTGNSRAKPRNRNSKLRLALALAAIAASLGHHWDILGPKREQGIHSRSAGPAESARRIPKSSCWAARVPPSKGSLHLLYRLHRDTFTRRTPTCTGPADSILILDCRAAVLDSLRELRGISCAHGEPWRATEMEPRPRVASHVTP